MTSRLITGSEIIDKKLPKLPEEKDKDKEKNDNDGSNYNKINSKFAHFNLKENYLGQVPEVPRRDRDRGVKRVNGLAVAIPKEEKKVDKSSRVDSVLKSSSENFSKRPSDRPDRPSDRFQSNSTLSRRQSDSTTTINKKSDAALLARRPSADTAYAIAKHTQPRKSSYSSISSSSSSVNPSDLTPMPRQRPDSRPNVSKRHSAPSTPLISGNAPSSRRMSGYSYSNEQADTAAAVAAVAQEMNNVQVLKRLSLGALPTLDPDLPEFSSFFNESNPPNMNRRSLGKGTPPVPVVVPSGGTSSSSSSSASPSRDNSPSPSPVSFTSASSSDTTKITSDSSIVTTAALPIRSVSSGSGVPRSSPTGPPRRTRSSGQQPLNSVNENDTEQSSKQPIISSQHASQLLWVPANVHPELAPQEWKSFVQQKVAEIRATISPQQPSSLSNESSLDGDNSDEPISPSSKLSRRNTRLSREISDQAEYTDGSDVLENRRKSRGASSASPEELTSLSSLSAQLKSLGELESLAMDPFQLARSLSRNNAYGYGNNYNSNSYHSENNEVNNNQSDHERQISSSSLSDIEPLANDSDQPIMPGPSPSLRRAAHTRYNKPSLRKGRQRGTGLKEDKKDEVKDEKGDEMNKEEIREERKELKPSQLSKSTQQSELESKSESESRDNFQKVEPLLIAKEKDSSAGNEKINIKPSIEDQVKRYDSKPRPDKPRPERLQLKSTNNETLREKSISPQDSNLQKQSYSSKNNNPSKEFSPTKDSHSASHPSHPSPQSPQSPQAPQSHPSNQSHQSHQSHLHQDSPSIKNDENNLNKDISTDKDSLLSSSKISSPSMLGNSTDVLSAVPISENHPPSKSDDELSLSSSLANSPTFSNSSKQKPRKNTWRWLFNSNSNESSEGPGKVSDQVSEQVVTIPDRGASDELSPDSPPVASPTSATSAVFDRKGISSFFSKMKVRKEIDDHVSTSTTDSSNRSSPNTSSKSTTPVHGSTANISTDSKDRHSRALNQDKKKGGVAKSRYRSRSRSRIRQEETPKNHQQSDSQLRKQQDLERRQRQLELQLQQQQYQMQQYDGGLPYHIPAHQMSDKSTIMMYHRYPLHIERAIYRLSHLKLANPRRPLVQQVLLSNFMYAYLNLINHGYQQQMQQMQQMQQLQQMQLQQLQEMKQSQHVDQPQVEYGEGYQQEMVDEAYEYGYDNYDGYSQYENEYNQAQYGYDQYHQSQQQPQYDQYQQRQQRQQQHQQHQHQQEYQQVIYEEDNTMDTDPKKSPSAESTSSSSSSSSVDGNEDLWHAEDENQAYLQEKSLQPSNVPAGHRRGHHDPYYGRQVSNSAYEQR